MTPPRPILDALALLDADYAKATIAIAHLREESTAFCSMPIATFEALSALYRDRDRLANVRNNLRAYYEDRRE